MGATPPSRGACAAEKLSLSGLLASIRIDEALARHPPEELFRRALLTVDLEATRTFLDPSHPSHQDPNTLLSGGFSPLHLAAMARSEPLVAMLLAAGAAPDPALLPRPQTHPLDRPLSLRWLGDGWRVDHTPADGETPLLASVFGGLRRRGSRWPDPGVVRRLLEAGADPNHADALGRTPLLALLRSHLSEFTVRESGPAVLEVTQLLLAHGASVHVDDSSCSTSITHLAAESLAEGVLAAVVDAGGDPLRPAPGPPSGWFPHWTAFHAAASRGLPSSVALLARRVADVDVALPTGHTPLHLAALRRDPACVEVLLAAGADPHRIALHTAGREDDAFPATPLDLARRAGSRAALVLEAAMATW